MTTITILPEKADSYRAVAGDKQSTGRTAGEALDALTSQLGDEEGGTLVIVQTHRADEFFDAAQRERLRELMRLRETAALPPEQEGELESLVEAELDGARRRAEHMAHVRQEQRLDDALSQLTPRERDLLMMSLGENLSSEEIAERLNEDIRSVIYELNRMRGKVSRRIRSAARTR